MEQFIITGISILMPCLLALYSHYLKKPTEATIVYTKSPVPYFKSY